MSPPVLYTSTPVEGKTTFLNRTKIYIVALVHHAQSLTGQSIPVAFAFPLC